MWHYFRSFSTKLFGTQFRFISQAEGLIAPRFRHFFVPTTVLTLGFVWPFQAKNERNPQAETDALFKQCIAEILSGKLESADQHLHDVLHLLEDRRGRGELDQVNYFGQRARVLCEMANLNLLTTNHVASEKLFIQAIQDCLAAGIATTDALIVELSLKLALIYQTHSNVNAETGFKFCINTQRDKIEKMVSESDGDLTIERNEKALLGMSHNYYSKFLFEQGHFLESFEQAEQALSIAKTIYPSFHPNCLHLSADLAMIEAGLGKTSQASGRLTAAITIAKQYLTDHSFSEQSLLHPHPTDVSVCLADLLAQRAVLESTQNQHHQADSLLQEAKHVVSRLEINPVVTSCLNRLQEVEQLLKKAIIQDCDSSE